MEEKKKLLADIFDFVKDTKEVKMGNRVIFFMIFLSVATTFLSSIPSVAEYGSGILNVIETITLLFFTVEYILRLALCGENKEKYRGIKGKIKYAFTFFAIIDILAILPFYVGFFFDNSAGWLIAMRVFRLFRLFRFFGSYSYIMDAFKGVKDQFYISMQFLVIITFVLSMILYYVEVQAQPDVYSGGLESLLWAFMQYIGDPGGFADYSPITPIGRVISVIIGVLGLAIFAIPAGLVGSAFSDAIESKKKDEEVRKHKESLHTAFSRQYIKDGESYIRAIPSHIYMEDLQARKGLCLENVQDIIRLQSKEQHFERYRLKDIGKTVTKSDSHAMHQLVVEHYLVNRSYGFFHREPNSKVTIVANVQRSAANMYAFYLAKMGGFSIVIKEEDPSPTFPSSWVSLEEDLVNVADEICGVKNLTPAGTAISKERTTQEMDSFKEFISDIHSCRCEGGFLVVVNAAEDESKSGVVREAGVHIVYGNKIGVNEFDPESKNISDPDLIDRIVNSFTPIAQEKFSIEVARNDFFRILKNNLLRHVWPGVKKTKRNKIVLKLNKDLVVWDTRCPLVMKELAIVLAREVDGREITVTDEMKSKGLGYNGYSEVETERELLKKMRGKTDIWQKEERDTFPKAAAPNLKTILRHC